MLSNITCQVQTTIQQLRSDKFAATAVYQASIGQQRVRKVLNIDLCHVQNRSITSVPFQWVNRHQR